MWTLAALPLIAGAIGGGARYVVLHREERRAQRRAQWIALGATGAIAMLAIAWRSRARSGGPPMYDDETDPPLFV